MQIVPTLSTFFRPALFACVATLGLRSAADASTHFHHLTASQYQTHFNQRVALGGRLISLHISGGNLVKHYSGVWEYDGGPPWVASHGMTSADYQAFYDTWKPLGFHPTILTATGSGSGTRYATVFEKNGLNGYGKHNLTWTQCSAELDYAREIGYLPRAVTVTGTTSAKRYGVVFETNTTDVDWLVYTNWEADDLSYRMDIHEALGYRPIHLAVSSVAGEFQMIWVEETTPAWTGSHSLTWSGFAARDNYLDGVGFEPYMIAEVEIPSPTSSTYMTSRYAGLWRYVGQ